MSMNRDKSPFLSLSELSEADGQQRAGKAPRVENSGLLDLRQMARVYEKPDQQRGRDQDAIPEPVTVGIGTPPGLMLPLPAPPDMEQQKQQQAQRNRLLYVMSAVAGLLGLAAMALALVLLRGGVAQSPQVGVPGPQQPVAQPAQPAQPAQSAQPAAGVAASAELPAAAEDADERDANASDQAEPRKSTSSKAGRDDARDDDGDDRASSRRKRRGQRSERRSNDRDDDASRAPEPAPAPAAPPEDRCMDEIACELAPNPPACCSRYRSSGSGGLLSVDQSRRAPADEDLPKQLERSDLSDGMDKVRGSVAACRASHPVKGTVKVSLKVSGEGKVDSVRVISSPTEGLGSCVASKVRRARFARTQRGATFSYPFVFH